MKNAIELAKRIQGVKDLLGEARKCKVDDVSQFVGLGLLNGAEYKEYVSLKRLEGETYKLGQDAADAVIRPDGWDRYPARYKAIVIRLAEIEPGIKLEKEVGEWLFKLTTYPGARYNSGGSFGEELGVTDIADRTFELFKTLATGEQEEYEELTEAKKRLSDRDGTIVRRVNQENYDAWKKAQEKARQNAIEKFTNEHREEFARYNALKKLVEVRRQAKLRVIGEKVRGILTKALK